MLLFMLLFLLACSGTTPPASEPAASGRSPPIDAGSAAGHYEGEPVITASGAGPYQIGMTGAAALALPGAQKAEASCSCAYDVRFPLPGVTLGVGLDEAVCQVWIGGSTLRSAAGLGVGVPLAHFERAYGSIRTEEATGMLLFADTPWLAVQAEPGGAVQAIRVGACPE